MPFQHQSGAQEVLDAIPAVILVRSVGAVRQDPRPVFGVPLLKIPSRLKPKFPEYTHARICPTPQRDQARSCAYISDTTA